MTSIDWTRKPCFSQRSKYTDPRRAATPARCRASADAPARGAGRSSFAKGGQTPDRRKKLHEEASSSAVLFAGRQSTTRCISSPRRPLRVLSLETAKKPISTPMSPITIISWSRLQPGARHSRSAIISATDLPRKPPRHGNHPCRMLVIPRPPKR